MKLSPYIYLYLVLHSVVGNSSRYLHRYVAQWKPGIGIHLEFIDGPIFQSP